MVLAAAVAFQLDSLRFATGALMLSAVFRTNCVPFSLACCSRVFLRLLSLLVIGFSVTSSLSAVDAGLSVVPRSSDVIDEEL